MARPLVNLSELEFDTHGNGKQYQVRMAEIAPRIGAQKLGYNLTIVPPGKRAFPFHAHRINEEMLFVLEGTGELRFGPERFPLRSGDVVACPPGGPEVAHQVINSSSADLRILAVSTCVWPEIIEYPDSQKFNVYAEFPAPSGDQPQIMRFIGRAGTSLDYWDGE
jgi:uncharacterized cupin superfamily protein